MKRKLKIKLNLLLLGLFLPIISLNAQNDSIYNMSLKEAENYALKNSPVIKNAQLDLESAKKKIWETTAIGLPQVNSKFSYSYMITMSPTIEMINSFSSLGANFGTIYGMIGSLAGHAGNIDVLNQLDSISNANSGSSGSTTSTKDLRWGMTYDITATQIIFSGAYLVGLQTAKTYRSLSEIALTKSQYDLRQNIASAYYLVLIAEENSILLDSTCTNTQKLLDEMTQMNKQGFLEETDVDQLQLTLSTLNNSRMMLKRQTEIAYNLLKYQIGLDLSAKLKLTEQLSGLMDENKINEMMLQPYEFTKSPDFMLLESQEKLSLLNVRYNRTGYLPDIVAFYTHEENFNEKALSFTPPDLIGISVSLPLFSSGMKHAKVQQAKIQLNKARITKDQVAQGLQLDHEKSKSDLINASEKFKTNKDNMQLAEKIYKRTLVKYKEGVSSSMELTQTQTQFLQSQSNYYTSLMELLNAKAKMEKLLNLN